MKNKAEYRVGVGASSILMILVVLALTALSLLSLKAAQNNAVLTDRNLTMTVAYYQAAADVQRTIAAIDEQSHQLDLLRLEDRAALRSALANYAHPVSLDDDLVFAFTVDAGADRVITVEGNLVLGDTARVTISRHELRVTDSFSDQRTLNVFLP